MESLANNYGYAGKILRVNLTRKLVSYEPLEENLAKRYLGGRGFGARILWNELKGKTSALSPDNRLIFAVGPLTGTPFPTAGRFVVVAKSPLTGIYGISTCGGRRFGPNLKFAGYDAIVIEGRSEVPTYIWINNEKVEFRDAHWLWGMPTSPTQNYIMDSISDSKMGIVCIGPAGENLVKFSSIVSEKRTASRCGLGAVMGSKQLKAVAIRGTNKVKIYSQEKFRNTCRKVAKTMRKNMAGHTELGTPQLVNIVNEFGGFPTYNFKIGVFADADSLSGSAMKKKIVVKNYACWVCPVGCGKISIVKTGAYAGTVTEGPEYETIAMLGANLGINSIEAVAAFNKSCDDLGLDTLSTGSVIAFMMECYERGLISKKEDLELKFGNQSTVMEMIKRIAFRQGIGNLLAEGVKRLAEKIGRGSEKFAIHSKGLEIPAYDPRAAPGAGLNFATASCGGSVQRGSTFFIETRMPTTERFGYKGKGKMVKEQQDFRAVYDCAVVCMIARRGITLEDIAEASTAVTGIDFKSDDLLRIGERINNLERVFNVREGVRRKEDVLPWRLRREPMPEGPAEGHVADVEKMLDDYYEARGWNRITGIPEKKKLMELGLEGVANQVFAN